MVPRSKGEVDARENATHFGPDVAVRHTVNALAGVATRDGSVSSLCLRPINKHRKPAATHSVPDVRKAGT